MRLDECMIICCYYRLHHSDDILNLVESFGKIVEKFPNDQVVLVGDMNFPGFDWRNETCVENLVCRFNRNVTWPY